MAIKNDKWIKSKCIESNATVPGERPMISPFVPHQIRFALDDVRQRIKEGTLHHSADFDGDEEFNKTKIISYGTSSFGYDFRIANEFKIFTNINSTVVDPKNFDERSFVDYVGDVCIIPPNSFVLARSVEYVIMPDDTTGVVLGKSTYARCGIDCLATPLEAGWEGHITLEFANTTPLPAYLYANEGACQVLFLQGEEAAEVTYRARGGKYQGQRGVTLPKA